MGNVAISNLGFSHNGHGIASALYGMFSGTDADYFSNTQIMNMLALENEMAHVRCVGDSVRWILRRG